MNIFADSISPKISEALAEVNAVFVAMTEHLTSL
jgi:hypothetical protein